jgi:hypothetical protein
MYIGYMISHIGFLLLNPTFECPVYWVAFVLRFSDFGRGTWLKTLEYRNTCSKSAIDSFREFLIANSISLHVDFNR